MNKHIDNIKHHQIKISKNTKEYDRRGQCSTWFFIKWQTVFYLSIRFGTICDWFWESYYFVFGDVITLIIVSFGVIFVGDIDPFYAWPWYSFSGFFILRCARWQKFFQLRINRNGNLTPSSCSLLLCLSRYFPQGKTLLPMHYYHDLALLYSPLIGQHRSRDLNTGLWLVRAQYTVSVCLCLLALTSDWSSTNQLKLLLARATADWTTWPLIGRYKSCDLNTWYLILIGHHCFRLLPKKWLSLDSMERRQGQVSHWW